MLGLMKIFLLNTLILAAFFVFSGCSSSNTDSSEKILRNQIGTLSWKGSPAVDGAGMLFEVGEVQYGAPGVPDDYSKYMDEDDYEVKIKADILLTGEETIRGWGAAFPEIEFIKIEKY